MFDLCTGIEIELVVREGATRFDLLSHFGEVELFDTFSKVPMPPLTADAADLVEDIARHHGAEIQSIAPDLSCFYLRHRAGRVGDLIVVHDNTIAGGERVAEVVTPPLYRRDLGLLDQIAEAAEAVEATVPPGAALHVHLDGAPFQDARVLSRLVQVYLHFEAALFERVKRPPELRRAGPMPEGFADLLEMTAEREAPWAETRPLVETAFDSRDFGLNLYNLGHDVDGKLTVEFKIAGGTYDPVRIVEIRELYLRLAAWALGDAPMPSSLDAA